MKKDDDRGKSFSYLGRRVEVGLNRIFHPLDILQMLIRDFDRIKVQFDLVGFQVVAITFLGKLDQRLWIGDSVRELLNKTNVIKRVKSIEARVVDTKTNKAAGENQKRQSEMRCSVSGR